MAKLLLTVQDAGNTVPLAGTLFWDVVGSAQVDLFDIQAGTSASILGGAGQDVFRLLGNQIDYNVHHASTNVIFTHLATGETVTIRALSASGDQIAFGEAAPISLKIAAGALMLGEQHLTSTPSPITTTGSFVLDGNGTAGASVEIDAGGAAFTFTDSVSMPNNVSLVNFTEDDQIVISGIVISPDSGNDYDDGVIGVDDAGNVSITYNQDAILNQITLVGVTTGTSLVSDVASFNELPVGNLIFS
jgi:hypothetical protein